MEKKNINIEIGKTTDIGELGKTEQTLVERAQQAAQRAYAPYSNFKVGASLLLSNGETVEGNNQENASYPCGCCAERTALHYANSRFPEAKVLTLVISAYNHDGLLQEPITPCGMCRQAILEAEMRGGQPIKIILNGKKHTFIINSAADLLPLSFDNSIL